MIVCVIGRAGSGKTTAAKIVCELTDMPLVEMSDFLKHITGGSERHEMNLNKDQFEKDNPDWLWQHVEKALDSHDGDCVLSGIREPYLLHKVLQRYEDVHIIGVNASPFTRYSRMCDRAEGGFFSVERFRLTEDGTVEDGFVGDNTLGIDITLSKCDIIFDGDGSVDHLKDSIQSFLFDRNIIKMRLRKM